MVKRCESCQFHAKQIHQPAQELQTIPLTWPFVVWGLDILGPFPRAQGGYRYLYIAINKFTKWVEVEPVCTTPARSAVKFIRGLVCRFGVPNRIITDNGSQFTSGLFREYCTSAGIKSASPQSPIPGAMAKPSVPTPKSSRDSRREASTPSSKPAAKNS
jgi:transposase InsO family protein